MAEAVENAKFVYAVNAVYAVDVVKTVSRILETKRYWMYVATNKVNTCQACSDFSGSIFDTGEVYSLFPDVAEQDDDLWLPTVHPNCLCLLVGKADDWTPDTFPIVVSPATEEPSAANPFDVSLWGLERAPRVHDDYFRIRKAFMKVYGPQQGGKEFLAWLRRNRLSPHLPYGSRWNLKNHIHKK